MLQYLCLFYDKNHEVLSVETISANDNESARMLAADIARTVPRWDRFEIWHCGRKIPPSPTQHYRAAE